MKRLNSIDMAKIAIKDRLVTPKGSPQPLLLLIFSLLLLRSRLITGPRAFIRSLRSATSKHGVSEDELSRALQQLYVKDADGTQRLLVPHEGRITEVCPLLAPYCFTVRQKPKVL